MSKTYLAVWYEKKALCPKCRVQPSVIIDYGSAAEGFWFKGRCTHCNVIVKWYKSTDLKILNGKEIEGEQLSLWVEREPKQKKGPVSLKVPK